MLQRNTRLQSSGSFILCCLVCCAAVILAVAIMVVAAPPSTPQSNKVSKSPLVRKAVTKASPKASSPGVPSTRIPCGVPSPVSARPPAHAASSQQCGLPSAVPASPPAHAASSQQLPATAATMFMMDGTFEPGVQPQREDQFFMRMWFVHAQEGRSHHLKIVAGQMVRHREGRAAPGPRDQIVDSQETEHADSVQDRECAQPEPDSWEQLGFESGEEEFTSSDILASPSDEVPMSQK